MRVLFPVLGFIRSGGFRVLTQLANGASSAGHEAVFVCPAEITSPYFPVSVQILYVDKFGNSVDKDACSRHAVVGASKMLALYRFIRKCSRDFDAIVASSNLTTYPVWLGSRTRNFYYIQAYEPEFYAHVQPKTRRWSLAAAAWFSYYLPFTRIVNADLYKEYKNIRANHVVPPGLDMDVYHRKSRLFTPPEGGRQLVVGCIGRLELWKGAEDVGAAVALLHAENLDVDLRVAFHPVSYPRHELVKPDGDAHLAAFYRALDIMIAPGHLQLGAVHYPVIEAMACGTTLITTGYQPASAENSYIVPIKDPRAIADAVKEVTKDPLAARAKADSAAGSVQRYAWPQVTESFYKIILLNGRF